MKKIILSILATGIFYCVNAQNKSDAPAQRPTNDPIVNGMPYSQWKAQQDALKQQRLNRQQQQTVSDKSVVEKTAPAGATQLKPVQNSNQVKPADDNNVSENKAPVTAESKPTADKTQTTVTKPEVPEQFKLPATQAWNGTPVTDKTKPEVKTQQPKLPEIILVKETPATKNNPANTNAATTTQPDNKQSSPVSTPVSAKKEN